MTATGGTLSPVGAVMITDAAETVTESLAPRTRTLGSAAAAGERCFHCGTPCGSTGFINEDKAFCCAGCLTVFQLLNESGLSDFYRFAGRAAAPLRELPRPNEFDYLDEPAVHDRLVDFSNDRITRVTFTIPAIHCLACVWLLENLFRLQPGIGPSQVNFPRKELALTFEPDHVRLSQVVKLLASLGYEPDLTLADLDSTSKSSAQHRLWLQIGLAGFAFGNTMLLSIANYLGLDSSTGPAFQKLTGAISLVLALPVILFSAADYWRSAWISLRQRSLNIEVPIALGIATIFLQSSYEVLTQSGEGYFDTLAGLLFFLLCGRLFQQKTFERLAFDRDYKSFFPLSVARKSENGEERVSLSELRVGDRLLIRNGELIPADTRLVTGNACIDYSFVTGESEPVEKEPGDRLYAGGRQSGGTIEVETLKPVSESYLTSLWNQEAFRKENGETLDTATNRFSRRFTRLVLAVAAGAALFWWFRNPALSVKAFASVLIVACPCALALAAPFALGTAVRRLGREKIFVKSPQIVEGLARIDAVVFDKTGTLTAPGAASVAFEGPALEPEERRWIASLARHSTHPLAVRIAQSLDTTQSVPPAESFSEVPGGGIEGTVEGREVRLGSRAWLAARGLDAQPETCPNGSAVHVALDGKYRGCFRIVTALRPETDRLLRELSTDYELALVSGDHDRDSERFRSLFGPSSALHFCQSPMDKLEFVRGLQRSGKRVMMVGDGLNDAGALKQSDLGVAVVEDIGAFSPASDVIMHASIVPKLPRAFRFARGVMTTIRFSFFISSLYNAAGIGIAAAGRLSPVVCAILMPLSSATVVAVACGLANWFGRRAFEAETTVEDRS